VVWVALLRAFHQTKEYSFLMISPKLLDFSPFFFLMFSPLGTADFFMLLEPPGNGYSLLCSKKQPPRHTLFENPGLLLNENKKEKENKLHCKSLCTH
jgi:hypothetical protein